MDKTKNRRYSLNTAAFFCFSGSLALIILLRIFASERFLEWYARYTETLDSYEIWMQTYGATWISVLFIFVNYILKSLIPWFPISCICVASAVMFEWYYALLINLAGLIILFTLKFLWGRRVDGGNAEKLLSKYGTVHSFIESSKPGSGAVLFFLRLIPSVPVNVVSCLYGGTDISLTRFLVISCLGFSYRLMSYIIIGRNVFDPASASFIVPLILLLFLTGMMLLFLSGALKVTDLVNKIIHKNQNMKGDKNDKLKGDEDASDRKKAR